ncbi:Sodium/solute symporter [Trinorchestia longiramus]|nr:Sodium/solute symporter [Trinorchestia longiramus]
MAASSATTVLPGLLNATSDASEPARLSREDYATMSILLIASAAIGIYYGFFNKVNTEDTQEFLMAGKSMSAFPVALSLIASFISAIGVLGMPSEVYQRGFIYYIMSFCFIFVIPSAAYLYLPVFWNLQVSSSYEYLEIRFHSSIRRFVSFLSIFQMSMYMAIVLYAPSLALSQVTGVNLYLSITILSVLCVFYTALGGLRAVIWTDALQALVMYGVLIFVLVFGTISVGGIEAVWEKAVKGGRAQLVDWDPNPTTRHTFWTVLFGGFIYWMTAYACNPSQVQRCLCVTELHIARRALWITFVGLVVSHVIGTLMGLVIYAEYSNCDPIKRGKVNSGDQLFPFFVLDTMGDYKGVAGLFIAAVFSASLSSVSSGINSQAAITLHDFVKGIFWKDISEATLIVNGVVGGPMLGVFTLGMFFPWANTIGCFAGGMAGILSVLFVSVSHQVAASYGYATVTNLPTSVSDCDIYVNVTTPPPTTSVEVPDFLTWDLFQLSYLYYTSLGLFVTIIVGLLASFLVGKQDVRKLNRLCLSPGFYLIQKYLPGTDDIGKDYETHSSASSPDVVNGISNKAFQGDKTETQKNIMHEESNV